MGTVCEVQNTNQLSHSRRLRDKIRLVRAPLDQMAERLWTHPRLREIYPEFLFLNHSVIRCSVPLMKAAAEACEKMLDREPVAEGMLAYLRHHIPEETGHDEWVLDDLETLGFKREEVLKRIPSPSAAALAGAQYYWIKHVHPVAILGFIAVLEGTPPDVEFFEQTADRIGVPRRAFSNLILHGKLDPQHRDDLDHALDALPLTEQHHSLMGVSAFQTVSLLTRVAGEAVQ
jgi:Iron-containing redox enzyme